jgi:hypothetical protein
VSAAVGVADEQPGAGVRAVGRLLPPLATQALVLVVGAKCACRLITATRPSDRRQGLRRSPTDGGWPKGKARPPGSDRVGLPQGRA